MLERAATQAADSRGSQGSKRVLTRGSGLAAHVTYVHNSWVACGPMRPTCVLVSCYPPCRRTWAGRCSPRLLDGGAGDEGGEDARGLKQARPDLPAAASASHLAPSQRRRRAPGRAVCVGAPAVLRCYTRFASGRTATVRRSFALRLLAGGWVDLLQVKLSPLVPGPLLVGYLLSFLN